MTNHSEKLTALGFTQSYPREYLQQFGQHGTEYGIASSMLMNLWLLDDGDSDCPRSLVRVNAR